ncbi:MAG: acyl-CoA dehydrogenase [Myxococcota bacterium]|nr:acyl-CoA dehydrogenase [Myxococcota bacterium]
MSVDLALDDGQQAIADAVATFCRDHCTEDAVKESTDAFPTALWRGLAELGVLGLATPEGDGGALEVAAAMETLGRAAHPGPLAATFFATQLLPDAERRAVAAGQQVVAVGAPPLLPWAAVADLFVEVAEDGAWLARPRGAALRVETLGGEPWGRVELERETALGDTARAAALWDAATAAYLAGAGQRLVDAAAEHARTRKQFGRAIGEFQAVAHPLAECAMDLSASEALARCAAYRIDAGADDAGASAAAARLSASRSALAAAHTAHQAFGALGITLEGPVFHVSRRIRQLASAPPAPDAARATLLAHWGLA